MAPIAREGASQFRVRFAEIVRQRSAIVDPFAVARAVVAVMGECTVRSASGRGLLWNEYRVIVARADFDALAPLAALLDRDLGEVLGEEVQRRGAELVGELHVSVVADEADELPAGEAVVRATFVPTEKIETRPGALTVRIDRARLTSPRAVAFTLSWPDGRATIEPGAAMIVGRPHASPPARFIALAGASAKINKEHFVVTAGAHGLVIARVQHANPVHVNGRALAPGEQIEVQPPVAISLSKGDLELVLSS
jgi:hypothetical protein